MKWTSLHESAMLGHIEKIEEDIRNNKDKIHQVDQYYRTPLHVAAEYDQAEAVHLLVKNGANIEQAVSGGLTALHIAALSNAIDALEELLYLKANVNKKDDIGYSALHMAAESGNLEVAELLLENKADDSLLNQDDMTPLCVAVYHRKEVLASLLYEVDEGEVSDECLSKMPKDDEGIIDEIIISLIGNNSTEMLPSYEIILQAS